MLWQDVNDRDVYVFWGISDFEIDFNLDECQERIGVAQKMCWVCGCFVAHNLVQWESAKRQ